MGKPKNNSSNENVSVYLTEMQRNYLDISRQISETVLTEEDAERYSEFTRWTWAISQLSEDFYKPDKNGNFPVMDEISLKAFQDTYHKALTECDLVLTSPNQDGIAGRMKEIAGKVKEMLTKDSVAMESVALDPAHPMTLDEIIGLGRTITVDLGQQEIISKGGVMSSRIPIQVPDAPGGGLDGYFTATKNIHEAEDKQLFFRKYRQKYPSLSEMFDTLENTSYSELKDKHLLNVPLETAIWMGNDEEATNDPDEMKKAATVYYSGALNTIIPPEKLAKYKADPQFVDAISHFSDEYMQFNKTNSLYVGNTTTWLNTTDGCNIDKRNAAMSSVSALLGKKGLVAESQPMIAVMNGVPTSGTFMTKAYDYNAYDTNPNNPMLKANNKVYENPAVFDDLAALQAIDFICGNIDRHAGNIMMRFGNVNGETKVTGVTAIDNDLSFGLKIPDPQSDKVFGNKFILPKNMGAIGQKTAQTILSLQEDQLRLALRGYGLREEEITAAWERTKILKDAIQDGLNYYEKNPDQILEQEIKKQSGNGGHPEWVDPLQRTRKYLQEGNQLDSKASSVFKKLGYDNKTAKQLTNSAEFIKYYRSVISSMQPPPAKGTIVPGHLRVVPENEWHLYTLDSLANKTTEEKEMNQFATLKNMPEIVKTHAVKQKKKDEAEKRNDKAKEILFGEKKPEQPKAETLTGHPIGTGIKYQIRKKDILGVDNPENIKITIDENQKLSSKSGLNSTRIPVAFENEEGKTVEGFFTAEAFVNGKNQIRQFFDREIERLSGEGGNPEWAEVMKRSQIYLREGLPDDYTINHYDLKKLGLDAETAERLQSDPEFQAYYTDVLNKIQILPRNLKYGYIDVGADRNGNIDKRNVAMSKMSELLGAPEALAQATTMQVQVGDRITNGVFMKKAPGTDFKSILPGDPEAKVTPAAFDGSPALKNIADIQIIDYICMNTDRNESNLFYQFSPDGTKCLGVTGIDNDLSFGTKKMDPNQSYFYEAPLNSIKVVSEQMADKIKNMSPNALIHTLEGQGLNQSEIYAAVDRFTVIQEKITSGQIRTVTDEEWKQMKLSDLAAEQSSLFGRVNRTFTDALPKLLQEAKPDQPRDKVTYTKGSRVQEFSKEAIEATAYNQAFDEKKDKLLNDLKQDILNTEAERSLTDKELMKYAKDFAKLCKEGIETGSSIFHGASSFYTNLSEQTKEFVNFTTQLEKKVKEGTALNAEDISGLISGINSLNNAAGNYISHVNDQKQPSRTQKKRKEIAEKLTHRANSLRTLTEITSERREVEAKPEEVMHRKLQNRQSYLQNHPELDDAQFKKQVATVIYMTTLTQNAASLSQNKKMVNALMQSTVDHNVAKIMQAPAFENMMKKHSREQIVNFAKEGTGQQLLNAYLKSQIQLDQPAAKKQPRPAPKKEPFKNER